MPSVSIQRCHAERGGAGGTARERASGARGEQDASKLCRRRSYGCVLGPSPLCPWDPVDRVGLYDEVTTAGVWIEPLPSLSSLSMVPSSFPLLSHLHLCPRRVRARVFVSMQSSVWARAARGGKTVYSDKMKRDYQTLTKKDICDKSNKETRLAYQLQNPFEKGLSVTLELAMGVYPDLP